MPEPLQRPLVFLSAIAVFAALLAQVPATAATVDLSDAGQNASSPQVAVGPDGSATVVWTRFDGANDRVQAVRIASNGLIGSVATLSAAGASASGPQVAVDSDGVATVVWSRNSVVQLVRYGAGGQVGSVLDLSTGGSNNGPQVAVGGDKAATVVWGFVNFPTVSVQGRRVEADGTMGGVAEFKNVGSSATNGRVAAGPSGIATVAFLDTGAVYVWGFGPSGKIGLTPTTVAGTPAPPAFGASDVQLAAGPDNGVTITWIADGVVRAQRLGGTTATLSSETASQAQVAVGPDNVASVAWRRNDGTNTRVQAVRVNSSGIVGTPTDLSAAGQNANTADVAVGPSNAATVVWRRTNGTNFIVQTADRSAAGAVGPVTDLSAAGQNGNTPQVSVGASGRAVATWARSDGTNTRVQAVILSAAPALAASSGTTAYTEDGVPAAVDSGLTVTPGNFVNLTSAQVSIQSAGFNTGDTLGFSNQSGISGSYNAATGVLSLTGSSSVANYQAALRSITFSTTHDNPATAKSVDFKVNDGTDSNVVTKNIAVTRFDDPPVAVGDSKTLAEDAAATTIDVLANDTDVDAGTKTVQSKTNGAHGTVAITNSGADLTYTPAANYCNTAGADPDDSFTYTLNGGSTATVSVEVTCADDDPVAVGDSKTLAEDAAATTIDVLANDTDVDAGPKTIASKTNGSHGTVAITNSGADLTYTPEAGHCNTEPGGSPDSFTYTLNGGSSATVSLTVTCSDTDGDGTPNKLDDDDDGDGVPDVDDAFPLDVKESVDTDGDKKGNNADTDDDGDDVPDVDDAFPLDAQESLDTDGDKKGNNADPDDDGDGVPDAEDAFPLDKTEWLDLDGDGRGDNSDPEDDGDGVDDLADNCPRIPNHSQADADGDGLGTACDTDELLPGRCANRITGTSGADTLLATVAGDLLLGLEGDDVLKGFSGDDCLVGGVGDDRLSGGLGSDRLKGHAGNDRMKGGSGDDYLSGGPGDDRLSGGPGRNEYRGYSGDDRVNARNGVAETVRCGSGRDRAVVDADDTVIGCETALRP